jgi:hypothetical protein
MYAQEPFTTIDNCKIANNIFGMGIYEHSGQAIGLKWRRRRWRIRRGRMYIC